MKQKYDWYLTQYKCNCCTKIFFIGREPSPPERCPWCGSTDEINQNDSYAMIVQQTFENWASN